MRLIQVTASRGWRGHEQKIIYLYEAFRDFGYVEDQWLVCVKDSDIYREAMSKNMQAIGLEFSGEYDFKFAKALKRISDEKNADLIFIHNSQSHTISVLSAVFYGLKVPLVLCRTLIKKIDTNFLRKWKYNYKGIKKIICITQPVVDMLKPAIHDHSRLRIVGILTDVNKFYKKEKNGFLHKELNIPKEYKIVGNVAAFTGFKDHYTWVNTVEELVKRGVKAKFVLVGGGPLEAEIKEFAKSKGLHEHIYFMGFRRDIPEILPEFDVFLFTSDHEPAGQVILEAYACNVPVVASDSGGVPEILIDNETGLIAQTKNPRDYADKVERILGDETLRQKFIVNGYNFLMENYTKEVIAKKMFDELNEVVLNSK